MAKSAALKTVAPTAALDAHAIKLEALAEIDRRSGWLDEGMSPFTTAASAAGRKASGDELLCSVE